MAGPGLLGRTFMDDEGAVGGGLLGLGPMSGSQKAAMLFAGLQDAFAGFQGRGPTNNLDQLAQQYGQQNYRQQVRQDRLSDKEEARKARDQARADQMEVPLSAEEALARGYRPGVVVYRNGLGVERLGQASDLKSPEAISQAVDLHRQQEIMSPEAIRQKIQIAAASRADSGRGVVVQPGAQIVDPRTGIPIYTAPKKPLPTSMQRLESEDIAAIQTAKSISKDLGVIRSQLDKGDIKLGPITTRAADGLNWMGMSNENSRRVGTLRATLEKLRNDSLRLNNGVQTEGDAQREWNALLAGPLHDAKFVSQRLAEIDAIDQRAATLRTFQINQRRQNYGIEEFDENKIDPPAALGGPGTTGAGASGGGWGIRKLD